MRRGTSVAAGALALLYVALLVPLAHAAGEDEERVALRALKGLYEQAVNEDKLDILAPNVDADFKGVMLTSEPVVGLEGLKSYWKKIKDLMGSAGRYRVTVTPEPAQFFGDIAVAQGRTEDVVTLPGKEYRFAGQWTAVCRKREGVWKLYRIHASMDPLENAFVLDRIKAGRLAYGGALLLAGLVGGGVIGAVLARRKARK